MKKKTHSMVIGTITEPPKFIAGNPYLIYPDEDLHRGLFLPETHYQYKCPKCSGEFNVPARKDGKNYCPFCGAEMIGLNG